MLCTHVNPLGWVSGVGVGVSGVGVGVSGGELVGGG